MLFNLDADFLKQIKEELQTQLHLYRQAIQKDEPFRVVKPIQSNIRSLRSMIEEHSRNNSSQVSM